MPLRPIAFSTVDLYLYHVFSYDWSGQMFVTGSNDGHVFVCDARVSNNFKVLGHLGQNWSIVDTFQLSVLPSTTLYSPSLIAEFPKQT